MESSGSDDDTAISISFEDDFTISSEDDSTKSAESLAAETPKEMLYCRDIAPPGRMNCAQHSGWGVCDEPWMVKNGWCRLACGR